MSVLLSAPFPPSSVISWQHPVCNLFFYKGCNPVTEQWVSILPSSVLGCDVEIILGKQRIKHITALSTPIWDLPGTLTSLTSQVSFLLLCSWGLPGPHSAIPAELAPGTASHAKGENTWVELNFTFIFIKPSSLWLSRVTHLWFSPFLLSHLVVFLTNTPLGNVLARRARFLTKIPESLNSTTFLLLLKEVKFIFRTAKMAEGENLYPNS